jgi:hypothetical protein
VQDIVKDIDTNFNCHLLPIKSVGVQGNNTPLDLESSNLL